MIKIDVSIGDTILTGKFRNKKTVIKKISTDDHGMPTINDRKVCTFRIYKKLNIFDDGNYDKPKKESKMLKLKTLLKEAHNLQVAFNDKKDFVEFKHDLEKENYGHAIIKTLKGKPPGYELNSKIMRDYYGISHWTSAVEEDYKSAYFS